MRHIHIKSGRAMLAAEVHGHGVPIVFLHARVADRRMWIHQARQVGAEHQAIAYDRRGFGETTAAAEDFSSVDDLIAVIESVAGGSPALLIACSQGGGLALDAALQYPAYVRGMVLIAPSVSGAPALSHPALIDDLLSRLANAEANRDIEEAISIRKRLWLDGPFEPDGRVDGEVQSLFNEMNSVALGLPPTGTNTDKALAYERLKDVSVPTLVICGDLDLPAIQERSRYVAQTVPNGKFIQISGAAHLPSLEQPQEVTNLIIEFIDSFITES
jgi:pimeloyl-ACP methyl ester carboxylesterase